MHGGRKLAVFARVLLLPYLLDSLRDAKRKMLTKVEVTLRRAGGKTRPSPAPVIQGRDVLTSAVTWGQVTHLRR
jgi:hypothetical protein